MAKALNGAAVLAALKTLSQKEGIPADHLRDRYAFTAFLRRLMLSEYKDTFTLKGSMIMLALTGRSLRPTKDIDLCSDSKLTEEEIEEMVKRVMSIKVTPDDGVTFDPSTYTPPSERDKFREGGDNYRFKAFIGKTRVDMSLDLGHGLPRVPHDHPDSIPPLLPHKGEAPVSLMRYPVESTLAEKMRAAIYHGAANTRLKDFFDLCEYSHLLAFDGAVLAEALKVTCDHFRTEIPPFEDLVLFREDRVQEVRAGWKGFLDKHRLDDRDYASYAARIREFMGPVVECARGAGPVPGYWTPEGGWQEAPAPAAA
jgi:hypothetical protein